MPISYSRHVIGRALAGGFSMPRALRYYSDMCKYPSPSLQSPAALSATSRLDDYTKHQLDNTLPGWQPDVQNAQIPCCRVTMMHLLPRNKQATVPHLPPRVMGYSGTCPSYSGTCSNRFLVSY